MTPEEMCEYAVNNEPVIVETDKLGRWTSRTWDNDIVETYIYEHDADKVDKANKKVKSNGNAANKKAAFDMRQTFKIKSSTICQI